MSTFLFVDEFTTYNIYIFSIKFLFLLTLLYVLQIWLQSIIRMTLMVRHIKVHSSTDKNLYISCAIADNWNKH